MACDDIHAHELVLDMTYDHTERPPRDSKSYNTRNESNAMTVGRFSVRPQCG